MNNASCFSPTLPLLTDYFAYQEQLDFLKVTSELKNVHLWVHFRVFLKMRTFEGTLREINIRHRLSRNTHRPMGNAPCLRAEPLGGFPFSTKEMRLSLTSCITSESKSQTHHCDLQSPLGTHWERYARRRRRFARDHGGTSQGIRAGTHGQSGMRLA